MSKSSADSTSSRAWSLAKCVFLVMAIRAFLPIGLAYPEKRQNLVKLSSVGFDELIPLLEPEVKNLGGFRVSEKDRVEYAGDFYRVNGQKIPLMRSLEKIAIRHSSNQTTHAMRSLAAIGPAKDELRIDGAGLQHDVTVLGTPKLDSLQELTRVINLHQNTIPNVVGLPVYVEERSGLELIPTEEFIVKLAPGGSIAELTAIGQATGAILSRALRGTTDQFILTLPGCSAEELLAICEIYWQDPLFEWAEPAFLGQARKSDFSPNDPVYGDQWHLRKIGAPQAWEMTTGDGQIKIAVIDDGMELTHEDLFQNLPSNDDKIPYNGLDDDENGWVDDYTGWDFYDNDNDPSPAHPDDNHGTATAGVAAAKGNNNLGVVGAAFDCKLMPLKVIKGDRYSPDSVAEAIYYAAGVSADNTNWRGADVISISLTFPESNVINAALKYASTRGRGGKGCPVLCASGNSAGGFKSFHTSAVEAWPGLWSWVISYRKDDSDSAGDNTARISEFENSDGSVHRFDSVVPPSGWSFKPFAEHPGWFIEDDPSNAYGTSRYQARPEQIVDGQEAFVMAPEFRIIDSELPGIGFELSRPCEPKDTISIYLWSHDENSLYGPISLVHGMVRDLSTPIGYPAAHPDTIAVGASTDFDYRADYSQYGPELDFVAPSSGGTRSILTTDRTGEDGYNVAGDYTSVYGFAGTSSSAPLAAAVAALMLSQDPSLSSSDVRTIMCETCEKIGAVDYPNGANTYYGHGRIDAAAALSALQGREGIGSGSKDVVGSNCFSSTHPDYDDWVAWGKPACWCAPPEGSGYQCYGDIDGQIQGMPGYRIGANDLELLIASWDKTIEDPTANPCADIDHKAGLSGSRVGPNDLDILIANWKKTDADLINNCPWRK